jgi:phospholipid-transporting ATPase
MPRVTPADTESVGKMSSTNYRSYCNNRAQNVTMKHPGNKVTTSKYNPITFLPKNLFEQFSRLANDYFLLISAVQLFTDLSPTSKYTTAGPFAVILSLNMVREVWEDSKRHLADDEVNNRQVEVSIGSDVQYTAWKNIVVGDIVRVNKNQEFPADLILLSSSGDQGMSYIDTCNLDGETNLKIRNSLECTKKFDSPEKITALQGYFEYEPPNNRLYTFTGKLMLPNGEEFPVDNDNILLRGSTLRNTDWILGQVIYTGAQSKIMMNAQKGRLKQSNVEHVVNYLLIGILFFEIIMVSISTIGMGAWVSSNRSAWYLPYVATQTSLETGKGWVTFLILLNNYVPISLYISLEIAKSIQGQQINWDLEMYHPQTDTPALTRTTNLNEELGQIEYIFSDKTGTLTQNVMEFRKCFINGCSYGFGTTEIGKAAAARGANIGSSRDAEYVEAERSADSSTAQFHRDLKLDFSDNRILQKYKAGEPHSTAIRDFFRVLSVSHTVVPEGDLNDPARIIYQAESPDEGALVGFAKAMGWFFCGRTSSFTSVRVLGAEEQRFEILNVNKFNSSRKRMSVVCRTPEKQIVLYCKGADNVMLERLTKGQETQQAMVTNLAAYATEGLRTLVLGSRILSEVKSRQSVSGYLYS